MIRAPRAANAGAALYVAGEARTLREGTSMARAAIVDGRAMDKLQELIEETRKQ